MTPNEYQKEALRTASGMSKEYPRILNGPDGSERRSRRVH